MPTPVGSRSVSTRLRLVLALVLLVGTAVACAGRREPQRAGTPVAAGVQPNGPLWMLTGPGASGFGGGASIARYDVAGERLTPVPVDAPSDDLWSLTGLAVAPDGSALAFDTGGGEFPPRNIAIVRTDGTGFRRLTRGDDISEYVGSFTADGRDVLFMSSRCCPDERTQAPYAIYAVGRSGDSPRRVTAGPGDAFPVASPDGTHIAYLHQWPPGRVTVRGGSGERIVPVDGDDRIAITALAWARDSRHLFVGVAPVDGRDGAVYLVDATGEDRPRAIHRCVGACANGRGGIAAAPDGRSIAVIEMGSQRETRPHVVLVDLATGRSRRLSGTPTQLCCLAWQPAR